MHKTHKVTFVTIRSAFFFCLIVLLGLGTAYLIRPFFFPLFWAAVVAVMFYPTYKWLEKHLKIPALSAIITIVCVIVTIFLPLILVSSLLVHESTAIYQKISQHDYGQQITDTAAQLESLPFGPAIISAQQNWPEYASATSESLSKFVFSNIKSITQNSVRFTFLSFIMLYCLYYFLKDGKKILERLMYLSPIGNKQEKKLYQRFTSKVRGTLKGTVIIGGIQGFLGWLLFVITGVEGAFVWGVVMTILSIVPAIGSFLVWLPAGIIMLIIGNTWQGVTILLVGAIVIGNIDNILRPPMVGKDIEMHPLLVLFSTLGGIALFGISGFIIGPVVIALFLAVMNMYSHFYKKELGKN